MWCRIWGCRHRNLGAGFKALGDPKFNRKLTDPTDGVSPKKGGTFFGGVPIIRTVVFWGLYRDPYFGKVPNSLGYRGSS